MLSLKNQPFLHVPLVAHVYIASGNPGSDLNPANIRFLHGFSISGESADLEPNMH